jgi:hypothetical protein
VSNLAELRKRVHWRTGRAVSDDALNSYINEALATLAAERDWPWLQRTATVTLVDGQSTYGVPADYVRTRSLGDSLEELDHVAVRDLEDSDGYTVEGDQLLIRPTPRGTRTLTHRYQAAPTDLIDDTDEPDLPAGFEGAVVAYAAYLTYARMGGEAKWDRAAERAFVDYQRWVKRLVNERRYTGPDRIRVRPGGGV